MAEEPVLATKAAVLRSEQRSAGLQNFAPLQEQLALERLQRARSQRECSLQVRPASDVQAA